MTYSLSMPGDSGEYQPQFHWTDSVYFTETGGVMMQNIIFNGIIDSLRSACVPTPPLRGTQDRSAYNTRRTARWKLRAEREATLDARAWVRAEMAPLWRAVFHTDPHRVIDWLAEQWEKCDATPSYGKRVRRMVSECLVERTPDE